METVRIVALIMDHGMGMAWASGISLYAAVFMPGLAGDHACLMLPPAGS